MLRNNKVLTLGDVTALPSNTPVIKFEELITDRRLVSKKDFLMNRTLNEHFSPFLQAYSKRQPIVLFIKGLALFVDDFNTFYQGLLNGYAQWHYLSVCPDLLGVPTGPDKLIDPENPSNAVSFNSTLYLNVKDLVGPEVDKIAKLIKVTFELYLDNEFFTVGSLNEYLFLFVCKNEIFI